VALSVGVGVGVGLFIRRSIAGGAIWLHGYVEVAVQPIAQAADFCDRSRSRLAGDDQVLLLVLLVSVESWDDFRRGRPWIGGKTQEDLPLLH